MPEVGGVHLPRMFVASAGGGPWSPPPNEDVGLLLRETSLAALLRHVGRTYSVAVDIDSIAGLADDEAASDYLVKLGVRVILTRNPTTAAYVGGLGALGFLRVFAVDSTGLATALRRHPRSPRVGSAISPGVVVPHLRPNELEPLPRPLLAYGLLDRSDDMAACLARADGIVVSAEALDVALAHGLPGAVAAADRPTA